MAPAANAIVKPEDILMMRTTSSIGAAAALLLAATLSAAPARAVGCKQAKLVGRYGFLATGNAIGQSDTQPYASGGVLTFNADGTLTLEGSQTLDGTVGPVTPSSGNYTLNENCTGSATSGGQPFFEFVVVGKGDQVDFIRSDLGVVITGFAKRVAKKCTAKNVKGVFGYAFNAIVFNIPLNNQVVPEALFAGGGKVSLDALGHAILDDTASFGGFVLPRHYEGTVTVNDDCTGVATVTLPPNAPTSANPVHVDAVWVDGRDSVLLIQTDPGTFIAGEARKMKNVKAP
jgi:hypothetical protein